MSKQKTYYGYSIGQVVVDKVTGNKGKIVDFLKPRRLGIKITSGENKGKFLITRVGAITKKLTKRKRKRKK